MIDSKLNILARIINAKTISVWVIFLLFASIYARGYKAPLLGITICDVGQGDAIFIRYLQTEILIDAGSSSRVLECLSRNMPLFDQTLEYVIETHDDRDHIGGLESVLKRYKVEHYVSSEIYKSTKTSKNLQTLVQQLHIPRLQGKRGVIIQESGVRMHALWPTQEYIEKLQFPEENDKKETSSRDRSNARSLVFRLEFRGFSALLTGDLEIAEEKLILTSGERVQSTLLKIGHHGSNGSTSEEFLRVVNPRYAVISVGKRNSYGHPSPRVLQLLDRPDVHLMRTDRDGEITYQTDGETVWVKTRVL